jgi:hypothetical protein
VYVSTSTVVSVLQKVTIFLSLPLSPFTHETLPRPFFGFCFFALFLLDFLLSFFPRLLRVLQKKKKKKKNEADNHGDGTRGQHGERADDFSLLLATTESFGRDVRICQR